ncbi:MAG: DUF2061 domain-containing protein [Gammaproteobacteria bacterium]|jgi:uncharacterized membrane protein
MYKTMTFALMHVTVAFTVAYLLTGSLIIGGILSLIEPAVNTVAYYFHEKLWRSIDPGGRRVSRDRPALQC